MRETTEQVGGLDVAVDAITVGVRHRTDLGNLDALVASIERLGLLQPITITPGRVLVCGWRRLEAVKRLGWTQVRVWVRSGLSDDAGRLLAENDENALRQAYTRTEQATLYRELKEVLGQDAQQRQEASRFSAASDAVPDTTDVETDVSNILGAVDSTAPSGTGTTGDVRDQAAVLATGRKSWQALERIGALMDLAVDPDQPAEVRDLAAEAVARIEDGGKVAPEWETVQQVLRARNGITADTDPVTHVPNADSEAQPAVPRRRVSLYALRTWAAAWRRIVPLLDQHDPADLGPELGPEDWQMICDIQQRLTVVVDQIRTAREQAQSLEPRDVGAGHTLAPVIAIGARS